MKKPLILALMIAEGRVGVPLCFRKLVVFNPYGLSRLTGFQRDSLKRKYQHVRQENKKKKNNHENHSGASVPAAR